ncbi:AlwI family type II restriction endonuclease [Nitrosopumilus sp.]|nr:AlwI family type II restriction endonuclease [Nitrosopumilus sp.]
MADNLWSLANTTIRNPERLPGALSVFKEKFHNKKSFAKGTTGQQPKFEKELGKHTSNGKSITREYEIPIVNYDPKKLTEAMMIGKNARMWISLMNDYGFINGYNMKSKYENEDFKGKGYITNLGKNFLDEEILRDEIWLRQILKLQDPHYTGQDDRIRIRGGWWFLKMMIECDGLDKIELGIVGSERTEDITKTKNKILDFRKELKKARRANTAKETEDKWKADIVTKYFETDWEGRESHLRSLIADVERGTIVIDDVRDILKSKNQRIVALGKGSDTKKANIACDEIMSLLEKDCFDIDEHIKILKKYYLDVKEQTVFIDYVDANTRILRLTNYLNWIPIPLEGKNKFSHRLKIYEEYFDFVKYAVDNTPCLKEINKKNEKQRKEYFEYLVDINKPLLKTDETEYVEKKNFEMEKELESIGGKILQPNENKNINKNRLRYNQLKKELEKLKEENFVQNLSKKEIILEIKEMIKNPKNINPITLESVIWRAIASFGGYQKHISETRNFGLDSNFNQIFTASGGVPDMQFHYQKFDEIVEVTKMGDGNKSQLTGEFIKTKGKKKPVPTHIAEHRFYNNKQTNCIFIAPSIHPHSIEECWKYSCNNETIVVPGNFKQSRPSEITFHIVPLTLEQFLTIFQVCSKNKNSAKKWIDILIDLHKITHKDSTNWMKIIADYVKNLSS